MAQPELMPSITADYTERIVIPPEDVIPKSSWFRFVKCSLVIALSLLIVMAIVTLIVAESFVKPNQKDALAIGVVSLVSNCHCIQPVVGQLLSRLNPFDSLQVGIILFFVGLIAIIKEHIPLVLAFAISMIIYLLVFMYSRVITSPGLIVLRTIILILLAVESFCFAIMIRDWRQIQISRLNQRLMKEAQLAQYSSSVNGVVPGSPTHPYAMQVTPYNSQPENPYAHIGPNTPSVLYTSRYYDYN